MNSWRAEIDQLSTPVTVIHGTDDPLTKIAELEAFGDLSRQKRVVAIEGGGHFIGVSHANEVWSAVALAAYELA